MGNKFKKKYESKHTGQPGGSAQQRRAAKRKNDRTFNATQKEVNEARTDGY